MHDIGTTFHHHWFTKDGKIYSEEVAVHGYVYYENTLYYVCIGASGVPVDVYYLTAHNLAGQPC